MAGKNDKRRGAPSSAVSLRAKRKADHYFGLLLAAIFEAAAYIAGKLLRRSHRDVPLDRVLVMKFSGMGSLALAYPALLDFKERVANAEIVFWGTKQTTRLGAELGLFTRIIELDDSSFSRAAVSLIRNLIEIWRFRPRWAFDLEVYSKLSSVLCLWTLAVNRVGFVSDTTRFRRYLHTHLSYFNRFHYVGDLYERMFMEAAAPDARARRRERDHASALGVKADKGREGMVVLNVNSGELSRLRVWPPERFRALIEALLADYDFDVALTGSADERAYVESVVAGLKRGGGRVHNLAGRLTLRELMVLLRSCRLFITNDSGPLHLAVLMDAPIVAIFGPTHPGHFLPARPGRIAPVYRDFICSPCIHVIDEEWLPCRGAAGCMDSIGVDEVYAAAKELLNAPSGAGRGGARAVLGSARTYDRE